MGAETAAGSVQDALSASVDALRAAGVEDPSLDAALLLSEAMGVDRAKLAADPEAPVPPPAAREFGAMVRRRLRREPVAYILGRKGFRRLELAVDRRVLIPRPETELLVEVALELRPERLLEVGTGSGAVALAIADELPGCAILATDTSTAALEVARANAERLGFADRIELAAGSLPSTGRFDLVLANLPYVAAEDWPRLAPEIRDWEPRQSLLAGADGLEAIRGVVSRAHTETIALEVGDGQAAAVAELVAAAGFGRVELRRDLAGIERVVVGRR